MGGSDPFSPQPRVGFKSFYPRRREGITKSSFLPPPSCPHFAQRQQKGIEVFLSSLKRWIECLDPKHEWCFLLRFRIFTMGQNAVCGAILQQTQETHRQHPPPVCCKLFFSAPPPPAAQKLFPPPRTLSLTATSAEDKSNFSPSAKEHHTCACVSRKKIYGKGHNFSPLPTGKLGHFEKEQRLEKGFCVFTFFLGNSRDRAGTFFPPSRQRLVRAIWKRVFWGATGHYPYFLRQRKRK